MARKAASPTLIHTTSALCPLRVQLSGECESVSRDRAITLDKVSRAQLFSAFGLKLQYRQTTFSSLNDQTVDLIRGYNLSRLSR